jgi:hypothetical protein
MVWHHAARQLKAHDAPRWYLLSFDTSSFSLKTTSSQYSGFLI